MKFSITINSNIATIIFAIQYIILTSKILTNIINIGRPDYFYLYFASYSNGGMIFETSSYPNKGTRIFYGFKNNGRGFFEDFPQNDNTYFREIDVNNADPIEKYESENLMIKKSDDIDGKEYLMSIPKEGGFVEIYDFEKNLTYQKSLTEFSGNRVVCSFSHTVFHLNLNDSSNYFFFGFIYDYNSKYHFIIQQQKINSIENIENYINRELNFDEIKTDIKYSMISCFQTKNLNIMCFLKTNENYIISAYDKDFKIFQNISFPFSENLGENPYYKCIHLKEEIGIFSYYNIKKYYGINNIYNPILLFKEYTNNQISDYVIHNITLESNDYHTYIAKNDIIRLKENKICFISMNVYNNILFINLINLYENTDFTVRYYKINMESEQNLKLWNYIKSHTFINFIAFAFSYESNQEMCGYEKRCSELLIFSYPNSSDFNFYLDQYLYNKSFDNFVKIN